MTETMIVEEKFDSAQEFLDELRVTNNRWISQDDRWFSPWIFRGQPKSSQKLLPHAWRTSYLNRFKEKYRARFTEIYTARVESDLQIFNERARNGKYNPDADEEFRKHELLRSQYYLEAALQQFAEMLAVKEFTEFADKIGHSVPGADKFLNPQYRNLLFLSDEEFLISLFINEPEIDRPFNVNSSAVALAQHHGIPTRLLDWTDQSHFAAFFAAESLTESIEKGGEIDWKNDRIAVWALSKEMFSGVHYTHSEPKPIQLITVPRHEIGFLRAQQGIFTHDIGAIYYFQRTGEWRSVEETLNYDASYIKKLTLPVGQVNELLRLLWVGGVSRAHLMPTYDNVTRALANKALWEGPHG